MKNIMTTENIMYVTFGLLTAIIVYKVINNKKNENVVTKPVLKNINKEVNDESSFCGCGA